MNKTIYMAAVFVFISAQNQSLSAQVITEELRKRVVKICEEQFPNNYYMIESCTNLHLDAMRWMSNNVRDAKILRHCAGAFPNNPYMIKSCYQLQENSKKRLYGQ